MINSVSTSENATAPRPGIAARGVLLFLRAYQLILSPLNFSSCKFQPTCSHYAYEAVQRYGTRRGAWLGLKRLSRCHPFTPGGFDPVPDLDFDSRENHKHDDHDPRHQELAR